MQKTARQILVKYLRYTADRIFSIEGIIIMFKILIFVAVWISMSTIALGQEAAPATETIIFLENLAKGEFWAKILGIMVGVQVMLYGLASGLTKISVYTENKWDNKIASWISQAAWVIGAFLGKFGYSIPKPVLEEKAKEIAKGE